MKKMVEWLQNAEEGKVSIQNKKSPFVFTYQYLLEK